MKNVKGPMTYDEVLKDVDDMRFIKYLMDAMQNPAFMAKIVNPTNIESETIDAILEAAEEIGDRRNQPEEKIEL